PLSLYAGQQLERSAGFGVQLAAAVRACDALDAAEALERDGGTACWALHRAGLGLVAEELGCRSGWYGRSHGQRAPDEGTGRGHPSKVRSGWRTRSARSTARPA